MNLRSHTVAACIVATLFCHSVLAQIPLGTDITYQGQLVQAGSPVNGPFSMTFRLFDMPMDGTSLGQQTIDPVMVTNGLFTVQLNGAGEFGPNAFNGDERWLEIQVEATTLAPRQPFTPTPYAHFALNVSVPLTLSGIVDGYLVCAENNSTFASTGGIFGISTAVTGITFGVQGQSNSTSGRGVSGYASATAGTNYGVYGSTASTSGRGVFGESLNGGGSNYGGYFQSSSSSGIGAYGLGNFYGVYGQSSSATGRGVYGFASGAGSNNGTGVYGRNDSANGWAVFAQGKFGASGTKSFRIDHPDDPGNKYLRHYSTESPEVINFYRGNLVLDSTGGAVVELPHYFAKVNKSPSYQLTAIGAPMPMLHVAEEIDEAALCAGADAEPAETTPPCTFRIAGGAPGAKVSWRVEAVRNDRWVQTYGAPVEIEKLGLEKGTYQHPELYGQSPESGLNYDANCELRESDAAAPDLQRIEHR